MSAAYDTHRHRWIGKCVHGDYCTRCDAIGYCQREEPERYEQDYGIGTELDDPYELRPVQRTDGSGLWDALDASGHGHVLGVEYRGSVEIWLAGYEVGAGENQ